MAQHIRPFLIALAVMAVVPAYIDVALRERLQAASVGSLLVGVLAFNRSLRYHRVRWRAFALVLTIVLHLARIVPERVMVPLFRARPSPRGSRAGRCTCAPRRCWRRSRHSLQRAGR